MISSHHLSNVVFTDRWVGCGGGGGWGVSLTLTGGTCGIRQETSTRSYGENTVHGPVKQKKGRKKQATSEDDKKSEARHVKGMKMKRHKQTACFSETWRWRNKAQVKTPLELIQTRTHSR